MACWRIALFLIILGGLGCERKPAPPPATATADDEARAVYAVAPEVAQAHPDLLPFIRGALDTVIAGDYTGYRRLVASTQTPEPREHFAVIQEALRGVRVVQIEPVTVGDLPQPCYRIVAQIDLDPDSRAALRFRNREIALLVFQEDCQWRLAIAPARLQPGRAPATAPTTAPADPVPDYPWERDVDY